MQARVAPTGGVMNEARMRMTRVPLGGELVLNKISGAPGFWIGNVIVMAGIPSVMQAMLEYVTPQLKTGTRMISETVRADLREGDIGTALGEIAKSNPDVVIGSYPFQDETAPPIPMSWCARAIRRSSPPPRPRSRRCWCASRLSLPKPDGAAQSRP